MAGVVLASGPWAPSASSRAIFGSLPASASGRSTEKLTKAKRYLQVQDRVIAGFPEVERVFGKAGRSETPTDPAPLSMVETVIKLKPREAWRNIGVSRWYSNWAPDWLKPVLRPLWPDRRRITWEELTAELNKAVIQAESEFDQWALSSKDAQGLMQLMPFTARRFGVSDSFDARQNIFGGARYLRFLLDLFHGDVSMALAGYNAGENAVLRFKGIPPFKETRNYVQKIQLFQVTA